MSVFLRPKRSLGYRIKKTAQLLDVENVKWLSETQLDTLANSMMGGLYDLQAVEENAKGNEVATQVKDELRGLVGIEEKDEAAMKESNELEQFFQQIRSKFLSENRSKNFNY